MEIINSFMYLRQCDLLLKYVMFTLKYWTRLSNCIKSLLREERLV